MHTETVLRRRTALRCLQNPVGIAKTAVDGIDGGKVHVTEPCDGYELTIIFLDVAVIILRDS